MNSEMAPAGSARTYTEAIRLLNSLQSNHATVELAKKQQGPLRNDQLIPEMIEWLNKSGNTTEDISKLKVIHVTGTKGKGSTCAFVQSISQRYNVGKLGLYTSPHLKSVRERIQIDGKPLSESLFARYFFEVWDNIDKSGDDKPAYFRFLTLISFKAFLGEGVQNAIYEVGVGGEYDSTNIFPNTKTCGISSLGIDHTSMLGNTLEEIAWNKSGIFKKGSNAFSVDQPSNAMKVIKDRAQEREVNSFEIVPVRKDLNDLKLGINGDFQKINASLAVALCASHLDLPQPKEGELSKEFIEGLEKAQWPGRCQILQDDKNANVRWLIDGAHTKESVHNSATWFTQATESGKPKVLLFNQQTRDPQILIETLYNQMEKAGIDFDHVIFTTNVTWSTGYSDDLVSINTNGEEVESLKMQKIMADIWSKTGSKAQRHVLSNIESSVKLVRELQGPVDVFVCGSLHLVGGFLVVLDK